MNVQWSIMGRGSLLAVTLAGCSPENPTGGPDPQVMWHVEGSGWGIAPSFDSEVVYFGGMNHELVAVQRSNGSVHWSALTRAAGARTFGASTARVADVVVLQDIDLYAFDAESGEERWMFRPADGDETGTRPLAQSGDTLYAASLEGRIYAIEGSTGTELWRRQLSADTAVQTFGPTAIGGRVYVGLKRLGPPASGGFVAVDSRTGREHWRVSFTPSYPNADHGSLGGAVSFRDLVVVSVDDGRIVAFDTATGAERWTAPRVHPIPPAIDGVMGDRRFLVAWQDLIIVGSFTGIVVGIDAESGAERWRTQVDGSVAYPLAVGASYVYVAQIGGILTALDARTGKVEWRAGRTTQSGRGYFGPGIYDGGHLYIAAEDGYLAVRAR